MGMTAADRLKLAREDYTQQEVLYNTLVLGQRFYIGIAVVLAGASISLANLESLLQGSLSAYLICITAMVFWASLLCAVWHLRTMILGEPWALAKALDGYFKWKVERLKQLGSGQFDLKGMSAEDFAEEEMLTQMAEAYADSTAVNREGNLSRQRLLQSIGKCLLLCLVALGLQAGSNLVHSLGHARRTDSAPGAATPAPSASAPTTSRHNQ